MTHDTGCAYMPSMTVGLVHSDIDHLEARLGADMSVLEARLSAQVREVERRFYAEMRQLDTRLWQAEMVAMRSQLRRWIVGTGVASVLAVGAMLLAMTIVILRALPDAPVAAMAHPSSAVPPA